MPHLFIPQWVKNRGCSVDARYSTDIQRQFYGNSGSYWKRMTLDQYVHMLRSSDTHGEMHGTEIYSPFNVYVYTMPNKGGRRRLTLDPNVYDWYGQLVYDLSRSLVSGCTDGREAPKYVSMTLNDVPFTSNELGDLQVADPYSLLVQYEHDEPVRKENWVRVPGNSPLEDHYKKVSAMHEEKLRTQEALASKLPDPSFVRHNSVLELHQNSVNGPDALPMYKVALNVCRSIADKMVGSKTVVVQRNNKELDIMQQHPIGVSAYAMRALEDKANYADVTDLEPNDFWEKCGACNGSQCRRDIAASIGNHVANDILPCSVFTKTQASKLLSQTAVGASIFSRWAAELGNIASKVLPVHQDVRYTMGNDYGLVAYHPETNEPIAVHSHGTGGQIFRLNNGQVQTVFVPRAKHPGVRFAEEDDDNDDDDYDVDEDIAGEKLREDVEINPSLLKQRFTMEAKMSRWDKIQSSVAVSDSVGAVEVPSMFAVSSMPPPEYEADAEPSKVAAPLSSVPPVDDSITPKSSVPAPEYFDVKPAAAAQDYDGVPDEEASDDYVFDDVGIRIFSPGRKKIVGPAIPIEVFLAKMDKPIQEYDKFIGGMQNYNKQLGVFKDNLYIAGGGRPVDKFFAMLVSKRTEILRNKKEFEKPLSQRYQINEWFKTVPAEVKKVGNLYRDYIKGAEMRLKKFRLGKRSAIGDALSCTLTDAASAPCDEEPKIADLVDYDDGDYDQPPPPEYLSPRAPTTTTTTTVAAALPQLFSIAGDTDFEPQPYTSTNDGDDDDDEIPTVSIVISGNDFEKMLMQHATSVQHSGALILPSFDEANSAVRELQQSPNSDLLKKNVFEMHAINGTQTEDGIRALLSGQVSELQVPSVSGKKWKFARHPSGSPYKLVLVSDKLGNQDVDVQNVLENPQVLALRVPVWVNEM